MFGHGFGMITAEQAAELRRRADAANAWLRKHRSGRGGWVSYDPKDPGIPDFVRNEPSNEEKGELEVFEFVQKRPDRYFTYYNKERTELRSWPGQKLADITWHGPEFRGNMGDRRFHIRARAVSGDEYVGTCTASAGDYCRIRKARAKRRR